MPSFLPTAVEKAVLRLFEDLSTPMSLKVSILWRAGDWDQLSSLKVDPGQYLSSEDYWRDSVAVDLVRKLDCLPTSVNRKKVAQDGFLAAERQCFRTNLRLLPYLSPGLPETESGLHEYFTRARKIAGEILGPCPDIVDGRFGPGATFGDRGSRCTVPHKMSSSPTITSNAWPYLFQWYGTLWAKAVSVVGASPQVIRGNRFITVPKDCTKDRGIAVEPSINVFYQLGYGKVIRSRLCRAGIDLKSGQDIHRRVACEASKEGHLATMDLSSASDTVCINLVKLVLPRRWYECLSDLRSPRTLFESRWHLLEKFSSMGNGFTFELETLVFLCLILALDPTGQKLVPGVNVYVYGDDIIVPVEYSEDVISALSFCGLTINKRKTFTSGMFRESCGGDFFGGKPVRPHFLEESPDEPQQLIAFANGLRRSTSGDPNRWHYLRRCWFSIIDALPTEIRRLRGPDGLGDLVLHDDEERWQTRWRGGIRYVRCYRPARFRKIGWRQFSPDVTLASAVYGVASGITQGKPWRSPGGIIPRDSVAGYKVGWVPFS